MVGGLLTRKGARGALYLRLGNPIEADDVHRTMRRNADLEHLTGNETGKGTERNQASGNFQPPAGGFNGSFAANNALIVQ